MQKPREIKPICSKSKPKAGQFIRAKKKYFTSQAFKKVLIFPFQTVCVPNARVPLMRELKRTYAPGRRKPKASRWVRGRTEGSSMTSLLLLWRLVREFPVRRPQAVISGCGSRPDFASRLYTSCIDIYLQTRAVNRKELRMGRKFTKATFFWIRKKLAVFFFFFH